MHVLSPIKQLKQPVWLHVSAVYYEVKNSWVLSEGTCEDPIYLQMLELYILTKLVTILDPNNAPQALPASK